MRAADFSIRHPAVVGMVLITLALFGLLSFRGMDRDLLANITTPEVLVMTVYPGASPEAVENEVTEVLEKEFSLIEGLTGIDSESHDGYSLIFLSMDWDTDLEAKKNDIRDRINNAEAELPDGLSGSPRLYDMGTSSVPVYTSLVESDLPEAELADRLENSIIPRFSRISDVSAVYSRGVESEALRIRLDPAKLESLDVTALEAWAAVSRGQGGVPSGHLLIGADRLAIQSEGEYRSVRQIRRQPVGYTAAGRPVYLDDVAEISVGTENPEFRAFSSGERTVALDVMKRPGGDTESLVRDIHRLQGDIEEESGGRIRFRTVLDDAETIGITLRAVGQSAWIGGLLAVLVLILFLHDLRSALIVTLSIPFTVFLTFILMRLRGMTLNIMTLAGITVAVGMMVDSSIVILENTVRHRRLGLDAASSASIGAHEVGPAVLASTSTSLSVFLPVLWVSGLAGAILTEVSWVLIFALASSALTAIFIVPWLASRLLDGERRPGGLAKFGEAFETWFSAAANGYSRFLTTILDHKVFVLVLAILLIGASLLLIGALGGEMFAAPDMNEFEMTVRLPSGYSLEQGEVKMRQVAELVRQEVPEMEADLWYAGLADSATIVDSGNPSAGYGRIRLVRTRSRNRSVFEIINQLNRTLASEIPDAEFSIRNGGLAKLMNYATDGAGFRVEVSGADWERVLEAAKQVSAILESDQLVSDTDIGVRLDREMLSLSLDRESTGRLAVDPLTAGRNLRILFSGESAGSLSREGTSLPLYVDSRYAGSQLEVGVLGRIRVRNGGGETVPYSAFSRLERRPTTDKIPHSDRLPSLIVVGTLEENDLAGLRSRIEPVLDRTVFPPGVSWRIGGVADVMGETFRELARALAIAVFLVYAVMVIQFERFSQPLVIMGAVPFVLIGVALSLAVFGTRISMMTFFGVIALGGMVVNNAIVLVEFANQRRDEGLAVREAIVEAARVRLRPILITTITTLLGLVPLALAVGEGSEIYAPLGQVIGGGLLSSTLVSLGIVPLLYEILENRRLRRKTGGGGKRKSKGLSGAGAVLLVLLVLRPGELPAQSTTGNPAARDISGLTALALSDDPALLAARHDAAAAELGIREAKARRGPVLDLEAGTSFLSDPMISVPAGALGTLPPALGATPLPARDTDVVGKADDFRYDISAVLEQPLFTWGRISSGVRMAEAGGRAAAENVRIREVELTAGIRIAMESLALIQKMKVLTIRQKELGQRLSDLTLQNVEEGFALETEYRTSRNRLQQILLLLSSLERQEKDLLLTLERSSGLEKLEVEDLILPDPVVSAVAYRLPTEAELLASAYRSNPSLASLRSLAELSEAELAMRQGETAPRPDLAFRTEFSYGGGFDRPPDDPDGSWTLTLGLHSTLADSGRSRAAMRGSLESHQAAVLRVEEGRREISAYIRSTLHAMDLNRENLRYFEDLSSADAARAEQKKQRWESGYGREEEWILAEMDRLASELQRLREFSDYLRNDRQLRSAAGVPLK